MQKHTVQGSTANTQTENEPIYSGQRIEHDPYIIYKTEKQNNTPYNPEYINSNTKKEDIIEPLITEKQISTDTESQINIDDNENENENQKYSLSHYMSTTFTLTMALIIVTTAILFVWSNNSLGAGVIVKVYSLINDNSNTVQQIQKLINEFFKNNPKYYYMLGGSQPSDQIIVETDLPNCHPGDEAISFCVQVFSFTLTSGVSDFWQAGGYMLAILIGFFSGLWPYVKLACLMFVLLVPMKHERRGQLLLFIDEMGKFSFIDAFVTGAMIVSFYVTIQEAVDGTGIAIDVIVNPGWGLTSFIVGTLVSMIWSGLLIYCNEHYADPIYYSKKFENDFGNVFKSNKNISNNNSSNILGKYGLLDSMNGQSSSQITQSPININEKQKKLPSNLISFNDNDYNEYKNNNININNNKILNNNNNKNNELITKKIILNNLQTLQHDIYINKYKTLTIYDDDKHQNVGPLCLYYSPTSLTGVFFRTLILVSMTINVYLLYYCIVTAPIRYNIKGLVAAFIDNPIRIDTIYENITLLPESTDMKSVAYFICAVYFLTVILMPMITNILLILLWIMPCCMNYNTIFNKFKHLILLSFAWSALDVFLLASVAASVELDVVSNWIINTNFASICGDGGIIPNILGVGCFSVKGSLGYGAYLLLLAVGLQWFGVFYTINYLKKMDINGTTKRLLDRMNDDEKDLNIKTTKNEQIHYQV